MNVVNPTDLLRVATPGNAPGMGVVAAHQFLGMGAGNAAQVPTLVAREAVGGMMVTKLTLTNFVVAVTSVTTGNGVGGSLLYTFPLGFIHRFSCRANLSLTVEDTDDFADAAVEGDLGIGTVAPANADALGTDATDDNWATATAFACTAGVDSSIVLPTEAAGVHDGSSTAVSLYLNALADAADIDNDVTTNLLISGDVWIGWMNQGGV